MPVPNALAAAEDPTRVPAKTVVPPVKVLAPVRVNVPPPDLVNVDKAPEMAPP